MPHWHRLILTLTYADFGLFPVFAMIYVIEEHVLCHVVYRTIKQDNAGTKAGRRRSKYKHTIILSRPFPILRRRHSFLVNML
ncbi:hypothetical protein GGR51DRAFT_507912, partial [Nemania sp. FL0031]